MGKISINLRQWEYASARHEEGSIHNDQGAGAVKDARRVYVKRALELSLLLVDRLRCINSQWNSSSEVQPSDCNVITAGDIRVDNFTVEVDIDDSTLAASHVIGGGEQSDEPSYCTEAGEDLDMNCIAEGVLSGVQFSHILTDPSDGGDQELMEFSDAHFRQIGLLLYPIFCRGESPSLGSESSNGTQVNGDSSSQTVPTKKMNKTDKSSHEYLFASDSYGIPLSICRLISDLIGSGGSIEAPFLSLDDIHSELKQLACEPTIFLYPSSEDLGTEKLDFGETVHGRTNELHSILQMAARVPIEQNTLQNKLVLIKGHAGSGKSFLVQHIRVPLSSIGFMQISAKFERLAPHQPLSTIASAFDDFFSSLPILRQNGQVDENTQNIIATVERNLTESGIAILSHLMPNLRNFFPHILRRVISDPDLTVLGEARQQLLPRSSGQANIVEDDNETTSNSEASRNRLHYLFRRLVCAISSPAHPLLIFLDDLQWIDKGSLDLISSLLLDFDHLDRFGNEDVSQSFLAIGTYRDDEVNESHILTPCLESFDESNSVQVNKIHLSGLSTESTNFMMSVALRLPLRVTRSLTDVIMAKTLGNPFHVKAFAESLVEEKLLYYSLADKRWVWDIEAVRAVSIDETVAELLARKLLQLPLNVQESLKVISCLGTQIDHNTLQLLSQAEVWRDLDVGLEAAVRENILESQGNVYRFAHDLPQQASYELMDQEERCKTHFDIGMHLISTLSLSKDSDMSPVAFIAISQINRAHAFEATEQFREQFAELNLQAGKKSIEYSDFASALSFLEYGIGYLRETGWESAYNLNLGLYENAALSCFVLSRMDKLKAYLMEIFEHALCLEDKLKGYYILIRSMSTVGNVEDATDKVLLILDELEEGFPDPDDLTPDLIREEMMSTKKILDGMAKEDLLSPRLVTDTRKIWALRYLGLFITFLYHSRPKYLPLVAARVIKISASSGYSSDSAFGFIGFGHAIMALRHDIDNAYRLGKMAMMLSEGLKSNDVRPRVKFWFYSLFAYWKEPIQSIIDVLRQNERDCLIAGENGNAGLSAFSRCRLSFFAGVSLSLVERECSIATSMMAKLQLRYVYTVFMVHHLTVLKLIGNEHDPFAAFKGSIPIKNEKDLIGSAKKNDIPALTRAVYHNKMYVAFYFKRYDEAGEMAMNYDSSRLFGILDIMHIYYKGLIALQLARRGNEDSSTWMSVAEKSLVSFRLWVQHSSWNFENRLMLLEAEWHHTKGEQEKAQKKYEDSIKSAREHLFVNEEGLTQELYSEFLSASEKVDEAKIHILEARSCYEKWGADALVARIDAANNHS